MKKWCEKLKGNLFFVSQFALDDFKTKYAGSVLGFFWAFVQPVITVLIYWFIFQIGFKNGDVDGYPFILWLVSGLLPWFFVSDSITNATSSLVEYSYLVKKVLFNINILPVARVVSVVFCTIIFNWFYSDIIYRIWTDAKCVLVTVSLLYCLHASCMHWNIVFHCITFCFF